MDKLFGGLSSLIKLESVVIDNSVFRLHYKFTVALLLAFSAIVTSRQYIGDPIDCISRDDIPANLLDTFCWIHSTFSIVGAWNKTVGVEIPYPGVDKYSAGEQRVYHKYYQWVCFVLFFQAMLFYVPRYLWKLTENNRVSSLVNDLNCPIMPEEKRKERRQLLVNYLTNNLHLHGFYAFQYFICECLLLVNVIGQMYLMDAFLGGEFSKYGSQVIRFTEWDEGLRFDPMIKVFPRLTKCTFHRYGSSGDVQKHDAMCILPINIINEKIYIFLWFWFYFLAIVTSFVIIYRGVLWFWPQTRVKVLRNRARLCCPEYLDIVLKNCKMGDWFLLDLLCKNMEAINYRDMIADLAKNLDSTNGSFKTNHEAV